MKVISILISVMFLLSLGTEFCLADDESSEMLGDAVLGGLLGAGIGAAIGSASGNAGKGAGIGAGVGALGNVLLGTTRRSSQRNRYYRDDGYYDRGHYKPYSRSRNRYSYEDGYYTPGTHRKIIREYDEYGNVISERVVYYDK